jgi:PAS domain S-box-containing protein
MIVSLDAEGCVTHFNPAAEAITGYAVSDIRGKNWFETLVPPNRYPKVYEEFDRLMKGGLPGSFENPILTKSGEERFISWANSEIKQKENVVGIVSFGIDITPRKKAEIQLQQYQQRLKALASQLTLAEERERRAIAADLHDHVGHSLALARMQLESIPETKSELGKNILVKDVSSILLKALQDTRNLISELSSPSMHEIGLRAAVTEYLEEQIAKRHGLKTEFVDNIGDAHRKTLDENVRALLFRNVRELLVNVVKHARASKVRVHLTDVVDDLIITVEDDGVGFNPDGENFKAGPSGGFGLFSIKERMSDLGGTFDIRSEPGQGCRVTLTVPVGKGKEME